MELINTNATAYDSWLSANMSSLRKAIEHLEEPNTNDIIEVTGRMIWQAAQTSVAPEGFEQAYSEIFSPIVKRPYPRLENGDYKYIEIDQGWKLWRAATTQVVPEGFVVLKISDVREILSNASDAMDAESPSSVFTQTGIPSTWYDHHLVAEKNILDAIKAQEPTND